MGPIRRATYAAAREAAERVRPHFLRHAAAIAGVGERYTVLLPAAVPGAPAGGAPAAGGTGGAASTTSVPPTAPPAQ